MFLPDHCSCDTKPVSLSVDAVDSMARRMKPVSLSVSFTLGTPCRGAGVAGRSAGALNAPKVAQGRGWWRRREGRYGRKWKVEVGGGNVTIQGIP